MVMCEYGYSARPDQDVDDDLVRRIAAAHGAARRDFGGHGGSFWAQFEEMHANINEALRAGDLETFGHLLRTPTETELHWGFDDTTKLGHSMRIDDATACTNQAAITYAALVRVGIACGALRVPYPEAQQGDPTPEVEDLIVALDTALGIRVTFPTPYEHEFGLGSSRGIIGYRAVHALYQAWRISRLVGSFGGSRVLEIGGGTGRTALYAAGFGVPHYTIVDIPSTQLAQASFLGRVLPSGVLSLPDEPERAVCLRTPAWLFKTRHRFDLVVNIDSLTEMDRGHAASYVHYARDHASALLSINHEFNPVMARELLQENGLSPVYRLPYWPRPGYVEELAYTRQFRPRRSFWRGTAK